MIRLAIYYTPDPDSRLPREAALWLGRDIRSSGYTLYKPTLYISEDRRRTITRSPFHYGFHATLKPPFRLIDGATIKMVEKRLSTFVNQYEKFILPPLELTQLDGFYCLRPVSEITQVTELAQHIIETFDEFRRPPDTAELQKRRQAGLTAHQEQMLSKWGYPFVIEEFKFHLTLTERITGNKEKAMLAKELHSRFKQPVLDSVGFNALSLFVEEDKQPMYCLQSFPLS